MKTKLTAVLLLAVMLCTACFAEGTGTEEALSFCLPESGISVSVPAGYYYVTKETKADDELFRKLSLNPEELLRYREENGVSLIGYWPDLSEMFDIYVFGSDEAAFREFSDTEQETYADMLASSGAYELESGIYEGGESRGPCFHYCFNDQDGQKTYVIHYNLLNNGLWITVRLFSDHPTTEAQEAVIRGVYGSIAFGMKE